MQSAARAEKQSKWNYRIGSNQEKAYLACRFVSNHLVSVTKESLKQSGNPRCETCRRRKARHCEKERISSRHSSDSPMSQPILESSNPIFDIGTITHCENVFNLKMKFFSLFYESPIYSISVNSPRILCYISIYIGIRAAAIVSNLKIRRCIIHCIKRKRYLTFHQINHSPNQQPNSKKQACLCMASLHRCTITDYYPRQRHSPTRRHYRLIIARSRTTSSWLDRTHRTKFLPSTAMSSVSASTILICTHDPLCWSKSYSSKGTETRPMG